MSEDAPKISEELARAMLRQVDPTGVHQRQFNAVMDMLSAMNKMVTANVILTATMTHFAIGSVRAKVSDEDFETVIKSLATLARTQRAVTQRNEQSGFPQ